LCRKLFVTRSNPVKLLFLEIFEIEKGIVRRLVSSNELVKFDLHGFRIAILGVLNQEHHKEGDNCCSCVDYQLPRIAESEERPRDGPQEQCSHGDRECNWLSSGARSPLCKLREEGSRFCRRHGNPEQEPQQEIGADRRFARFPDPTCKSFPGSSWRDHDPEADFPPRVERVNLGGRYSKVLYAPGSNAIRFCIMKRKGSAVWKGGLKDGSGVVSTESGVLSSVPYSFAKRFGDEAGTNPEELIGAAHAGCFSMAFSAQLGEAGVKPEKIETTATVTIENVGGGFTITAVHLDVQATIPNLEDSKFQEIAKKAKEGCPVSKLFKADITMDAKLA
jgi:lipoyl-dependent peroxiredoxin